MERVEEEITGAVTGESAARTIAAMCGRCEPDDEKLGARVAEARYGLTPVVPVEKGTAFGASDGFAVADEAWAFAARYNSVVQDFQRARGAWGSHQTVAALQRFA